MQWTIWTVREWSEENHRNEHKCRWNAIVNTYNSRLCLTIDTSIVILNKNIVKKEYKKQGVPDSNRGRGQPGIG